MWSSYVFDSAAMPLHAPDAIGGHADPNESPDEIYYGHGGAMQDDEDEESNANSALSLGHPSKSASSEEALGGHGSSEAHRRYPNQYP